MAKQGGKKQPKSGSKPKRSAKQKANDKKLGLAAKARAKGTTKAVTGGKTGKGGKKPRSAKQLANDKKLGQRAKARAKAVTGGKKGKAAETKKMLDKRTAKKSAKAITGKGRSGPRTAKQTAAWNRKVTKMKAFVKKWG